MAHRSGLSRPARLSAGANCGRYPSSQILCEHKAGSHSFNRIYRCLGHGCSIRFSDRNDQGHYNWVWPLKLPNRVLSDRVKIARHALALDDERTTFHPVLWAEQQPGQPAPAVPATIDGRKLVQVWLVGCTQMWRRVSSRAVAFVPLYWILEEGRKCGLSFKVGPDADPN